MSLLRAFFQSLQIAGYMLAHLFANSSNLAFAAASIGAVQTGRRSRAIWSQYFRARNLNGLQIRRMMQACRVASSHVVVINSGSAFQAVADHDAYLLNATVLYLGEHTQPEPRALTALTGPDTEDVPFPDRGNAHSDLEPLVADLPVTDLHHDHVDEHHRVNTLQQPVEPFGHLLDELVGDLRDRVPRHQGSIPLVQVRCDLTSHQPARAQQQNDLIDPLQPPLPLADDLRPEQPVPIPRNLNLNRTDLSEHRPGPRAVARVLTVDDLVPLAPKALSHLRLQRGLQHRLHEPAKQTTQPHETNAQLLHPREQPLSNLLLINDLSRHRIEHLDDLAHNPSFQSNKPQIHHFPDSPIRTAFKVEAQHTLVLLWRL